MLLLPSYAFPSAELTAAPAPRKQVGGSTCTPFPHSGWLTKSATRTGHVAQVWLWGMFSAPHTCWQTPTPSPTLAFELRSHVVVWVGVVCAT